MTFGQSVSQCVSNDDDWSSRLQHEHREKEFGSPPPLFFPSRELKKVIPPSHVPCLMTPVLVA